MRSSGDGEGYANDAGAGGVGRDAAADQWRQYSSAMDMRASLYPPIEPADCGTLALDYLHAMYWETCGDARGIPVIVLHGGPGGGCSNEHRRLFDPDAFRVVLFDQRGAGRSTPHGETAANTTAHLLRDIETLRDYLGLGRVLLFGGSWGATLALAYGQACPEHCLAFLLRGAFLGRSSETRWFLHGARHAFPQAWQRFAAALPEAERGDLLHGYVKRLFDADPHIHLPAARAWVAYESTLSTRIPDLRGALPAADAVALARIEAHYFAHDCFLAPDQLLDKLHRVAHLPAALVHGQHDAVCRPESSAALARRWPHARHVVVPDAGHSLWEPALCAAVVGELERFKRTLA